MSITDQVILSVVPEYEKPWTLSRGKEMFYDENDVQRRWYTWQEAVEWCEANLGVSPLQHLPVAAKKRAEAKLRDPRQKRLF